MTEKENSTINRQSLSDENEAIYRILTKILKTWQPETEEKKVAFDEAETVTLSFKRLKKESPSAVEEPGETVVLSRRDVNKGHLPEKKELDKKVILSPEGINKNSITEKVEKPRNSNLETVTIKPHSNDDETLITAPRILPKDTGEKEKSGFGEMDVKKPECPDFLTETVILKPVPEKEELNKTVILSPEGVNKNPVTEKVEKPQEHIPETVIISPNSTDDETLISAPRTLSKNAGDKDNSGSGEMDVKKPEEPDFLTETVILKPGKMRGEE